MGLLKILGLEKDKTVEQLKPSVNASDKPTKTPHDNGGCCGGCGSQ